MDKQSFFTLIDKYRDGTATEAERTLVEAYYRRLEMAGETELPAEEEEILRQTIYAQIINNIKSEPPVKKLAWRWMAAAASILVLLGAGAWYFFFNTNTPPPAPPVVKKQPVNDRPPGCNAAVLTLADGKTIVLDSSSGTISNQGGVTVINMSGLLSYENKQAADAAPVFNTVTTARGNQYQLVLADGSKVWLNSASSLRFPTVFNGGTREVELKGEGYFEIAKNPEHPFIVNISGNDAGRVEVLGTHFNVNCYPDEDAVKTTLMEGSVKFVNRQSAIGNDKSIMLKPGEQAILTADSRLTVADNIDLDVVLAWKNGWFEFDQTDLKTIMRQISRWYDVDIVYTSTPTREKFGGRIGRNSTLTELLKGLESPDVKFRLEGKKLIVN